MEGQMRAIVSKGTSELTDQERVKPACREDQVREEPESRDGLLEGFRWEDDSIPLVHENVVVDVSREDVHEVGTVSRRLRI